MTSDFPPSDVVTIAVYGGASPSDGQLDVSVDADGRIEDAARGEAAVGLDAEPPVKRSVRAARRRGRSWEGAGRVQQDAHHTASPDTAVRASHVDTGVLEPRRWLSMYILQPLLSAPEQTRTAQHVRSIQCFVRQWTSYFNRCGFILSVVISMFPAASV